MPYDRGCSVYWCDKCGGMMDIDYPTSSEHGLVLKCARRNEPCDFRRHFLATDEEAFNEYGVDRDDQRVDDTGSGIPVTVLRDGTPELVDGVELRENTSPERPGTETFTYDPTV